MMDFEKAFDVIVLACTVFAGAGLGILVLAPLVFEGTPPEVRRMKPAIFALVALAAALLALESLVIHAS